MSASDDMPGLAPPSSYDLCQCIEQLLFLFLQFTYVKAETTPHYEPEACNERRSLGSPHGQILAMVHTGYTVAVYLCFHVMW